ncbi:MAG: exodeoxyribonuclease III [Odoribacter sp.]|nr:exodeoxyribonuclease III [Odoribacter sp.]
MKLISWNVNGLRAITGKGFADIFKCLDADCVCLQETKLQEGQIDLEFDGYRSYYNYAERKGYSGTVIFTRLKTCGSSLGIGVDMHDHEGRVITIDLESAFLVNVYTPNSQNELARLDYRIQWEHDFAAYVRKLDAIKPVIICGDLNVAHKEIDLKNPKTNRRNPGFTDEERNALTELLDSGFVDSFRYLHPDVTDAYSWWSYRFNSRAKNVGWRIDYFLVSERIAEKLVSAEIHNEIMGSDHCPVSIDINL